MQKLKGLIVLKTPLVFLLLATIVSGCTTGSSGQQSFAPKVSGYIDTGGGKRF
jgi:hypothetical protein